jgi:hypothetical protein
MKKSRREFIKKSAIGAAGITIGGIAITKSYGNDFSHRRALMWNCEEWTLENSLWSGNPFDVIATVNFLHQGTGEKYTTQMFYAGNNSWKFRFTGTRKGMWSFSTSSQHEKLDSLTGTVLVSPQTNPAIKGFLTHVGNKYAIMVKDKDHLQGYVYQVFMNQQDFEQQYEHNSRILGHPDRAHLIPEYWRNTRENGFDIYFFAVFYSWFRMGALSISDFSSAADPKLDQPDLALFKTLEYAIQYANAKGGHMHIWAWGDNDRKQTPNHLSDGFRGERHRRLIRYIAARLGPLPGWSMNFGFDTIEMPNAKKDAAWWAEEMNRTMGWPHILTSRGWYDENFGACSYAGFGGFPYELETADKGPVNYEEIRQHMDSHRDKPSIYEERHTYNRWQCWPVKVAEPNRLNESGCRRLIWWETMAGGMGGFFGHFSERFNQFGPFHQEGPCGYHPDSLKRAFRTHRDFWRNGRLKLDMSPDNSRVQVKEGYCLVNINKTHFVFYFEDVESVTIDLSKMPGRQPIIAVDTKEEYKEIVKGKLRAGIYTISLDRMSDWVIAIGEFRTE